ncbi:MAG: PGPGW domain-containing protein, partial [Actinomycetota bacterium]
MADDERPAEPDAAPEHPRLERLQRAAIEAEFETGRREDTEEEAKDAIHVRLIRMTAGFVVLATGIALLALPGPGWITIGIGLVILSKDFVWAERVLERIKDRLPQEEDGSIDPKVIVFSVVMFVGALAA